MLKAWITQLKGKKALARLKHLRAGIIFLQETHHWNWGPLWHSLTNPPHRYRSWQFNYRITTFDSFSDMVWRFRAWTFCWWLTSHYKYSGFYFAALNTLYSVSITEWQQGSYFWFVCCGKEVYCYYFKCFCICLLSSLYDSLMLLLMFIVYQIFFSNTCSKLLKLSDSSYRLWLSLSHCEDRSIEWGHCNVVCKNLSKFFLTWFQLCAPHLSTRCARWSFRVLLTVLVSSLLRDIHVSALLSLKTGLSAADVRSIRQSVGENREPNVSTNQSPLFFSKVKVKWINNKINQIGPKTWFVLVC